MRMIRAVIRPDREEQVVNALESSGIVSLTKMDVFGRGQQKGVQVGNTIYSELPKVMLTIVVDESSSMAPLLRFKRLQKPASMATEKSSSVPWTQSIPFGREREFRISRANGTAESFPLD